MTKITPKENINMICDVFNILFPKLLGFDIMISFMIKGITQFLLRVLAIKKPPEYSDGFILFFYSNYLVQLAQDGNSAPAPAPVAPEVFPDNLGPSKVVTEAPKV